MSNFWLKVCSLIVAVLMACFVNYFFVNDQGNASVLQVIVPVEVKNLPPDKMIILPLNRQAEVTLRGPSLFLSRITSAPLIFRVSAPADAKAFVATLRREDLNLPPYVQVLNIRPREIEFILDRRISKTVPVVVPKIGSLPENIKLEELRVTPDKIEVRGPETELKGLLRLETLPLDLREIEDSLNKEMELRLPGGLSEVGLNKVSVHVEVVPLRGEEQFENLPIEIRSLRAEGFGINPTSVSVKVAGPRTQIRALRREEIIPYVRMAETAGLGESLKVSVDVPKGLVVVAVSPEKVVTVKAARSGQVYPKSGGERVKR